MFILIMWNIVRSPPQLFNILSKKKLLKKILVGTQKRPISTILMLPSCDQHCCDLRKKLSLRGNYSLIFFKLFSGPQWVFLYLTIVFATDFFKTKWAIPKSTSQSILFLITWNECQKNVRSLDDKRWVIRRSDGRMSILSFCLSLYTFLYYTLRFPGLTLIPVLPHPQKHVPTQQN